MCILFVLPQNVVFAATQKSFSYVKESEIFSCNYNMITDGATSVDSSMSPRLYGPFLDTDRIFKGEGPDGYTVPAYAGAAKKRICDTAILYAGAVQKLVGRNNSF